MFYKQFLTIIDALNPEFVENFDFWLATLPLRNQKNITASLVSARFGVKYVLAESILKYAEEQEILKKQYEIKCPECNFSLGIYSKDELAEILLNPQFCTECEDYKQISTKDIYTTYKVVLKPSVSEADIARSIEKRLNQGEGAQENFSKADSLFNDPISLYDIFYNPSESAYIKFKSLKDRLDLDYKKNTTAQGNALEDLILEIFNCIKGVVCSKDVKTKTNQFDCTCLCGIDTVYPSIFNYLSPYFIIECKNEPENKPNNTYCNKLESIMATDDSKVGIIFGRLDATSTCFTISREHYLVHKNMTKQQIIITCSDVDLGLIIDGRVNLLRYIEFKLLQITTNSPKAKYEMFCKTGKINT